jgi:hypothetical protein
VGSVIGKSGGHPLAWNATACPRFWWGQPENPRPPGWPFTWISNFRILDSILSNPAEFELHCSTFGGSYMRLQLCILITCLLLSVPSFANTYEFTMTNGAHTVTFSLPSSPTPDLADDFAFSFFDYPMLHDGSPITCSVDFYSSLEGGGIGIYNGDCGSLMNGVGTELYTGPTSAPTFRLGTFTLDEFGNSSEPGPFTLTITDASAVPEPSSLLFVISGALGVVRRRVTKLFS